MPEVKPFAALRPRPELADRICELPYDVLSSEEARQQAQANPLSFFHVSKPEIDLPPGTEFDAPAVYEQGRRSFTRLITEGALVPDRHPCFYLYRQIMGRHSQIGIVGVASCADYRAGAIKKHELTRVDKENDRVRHIDALNAQTGPAFLVYRADPELAQLVARRTLAAPAIDFTAPDGIRHSAWVVDTAVDMSAIESAFAGMSSLYIADGHHRTAAASRVDQARRGQGGSSHFLAVLFPHDQLQILPYHRVLKDLPRTADVPLLERLAQVLEPAPGPTDQPAAKHEVSLYFQGRWERLRFRANLTQAADPVEQLDVSLLQRQVLEPVFGITDPRTSDRIDFVGGIRGTAELERLVDTGRAGCAFALAPTSIEDLIAIADRGGIMPPKSTWFEPKLRDALFCHRLA